MSDDLVKRLRLEAAHDMEWANNPEILVGQAADRIEELENALREYMEHDADYARLNALGDHTQSHRHKRATAALQKGKTDD
jgi:hypothetical protein